MNAYEKLGIEEVKHENIDEEGDINQYIRRKAQIIMDGLVRELKIIEGVEEYSKPKLEDLCKVIKKMLLTAVSYNLVEDGENRGKYAKCGMPEPEEELRKILRKMNLRNLTMVKGQLTNAYKILGTRDLSLNQENQNDLDSNDVIRKTIQLIEASIRNESCMQPGLNNDHLGKGAQRIILSMYRYIWAFSKINTKEKREEYNEKCRRELYYRRTEEKAKSEKSNIYSAALTPIEYARRLELDDTQKQSDGLISITECAKLHYEYEMGNNITLTQYVVKKTDSNGNVNEYKVFSNIDIERMRRDPEYAIKVQKTLLSNENIQLGETFLKGYIGELDENGQLKLSQAKAGACMYINEQTRQKQRYPSAPKAPEDPGNR